MCELLYNSAKYSDGEHIRLHVSQMENFIRFTFEDIGPGLSEDAESMIFKPFMKVDDLSEGLGLGLPLCNRHLASLGGKLIYDTTYRSGCRFFMDLPK
jgi:signal transduction histidine kinase